MHLSVPVVTLAQPLLTSRRKGVIIREYQRETLMTRLTQMIHEWLDTPVHELSDNTIMILKHELLTKVTQLNNELTDREEATT